MAGPGVPGPLALRAGEYQRRDANGVSNKINRRYEFEPQRIDPETVARRVKICSRTANSCGNIT
jgi:hypothetical protein